MQRPRDPDTCYIVGVQSGGVVAGHSPQQLHPTRTEIVSGGATASLSLRVSLQIEQFGNYFKRTFPLVIAVLPGAKRLVSSHSQVNSGASIVWPVAKVAPQDVAFLSPSLARRVSSK